MVVLETVEVVVDGTSVLVVVLGSVEVVLETVEVVVDGASVLVVVGTFVLVVEAVIDYKIYICDL